MRIKNRSGAYVNVEASSDVKTRETSASCTCEGCGHRIQGTIGAVKPAAEKHADSCRFEP